MARKSGWQQFAENYRAMYDATTDHFRTMEEERVMEEELDAGLSDAEMRAIRYGKLADVKAKYGDTKGAMELRRGLIDMKAKQQQYDQAAELHPERLRQAQLTNSGLEATNSHNSKMHPLQIQTAQQNASRTALELKEARRRQQAIAERRRYINTNPDATLQDITNHMRGNGLWDVDEVAAFESSMTERDLNRSKQKAAQFAADFEVAYASEGLDGAVSWYDKINDGFEVEVSRAEDGSVRMFRYPTGRADKKTVFLQAANDAEAALRLKGMLNPATMLSLAQFETEKAKAAKYSAEAKVGGGDSDLTKQYLKAATEYDVMLANGEIDSHQHKKLLSDLDNRYGKTAKRKKPTAAELKAKLDSLPDDDPRREKLLRLHPELKGDTPKPSQGGKGVEGDFRTHMVGLNGPVTWIDQEADSRKKRTEKEQLAEDIDLYLEVQKNLENRPRNVGLVYR